MTTPSSSSERVKFVGKLPPQLRKSLKTAAVVGEIDIQDAVELAIAAWMSQPPTAEVSTFGAVSFATFLPPGMEASFKQACTDRNISVIQGLSQAVTAWINTQSSLPKPLFVRRIIVCNQKGGVGKTAVTAAVAQALAEFGLRVLMVDYDPQGHLTSQLGVEKVPLGVDSLAQHMTGQPRGKLADLVASIPGDRFGERLFLLPACNDAFLLDPQLATVRGRERTLEKALVPLEADYDVIIVDCPPSLGMAVDAALYYSGTREGERERNSGIIIPVQAEDSSAEAYVLLSEQIEAIKEDLRIDVDTLGLIVNLYSAQRGHIATSSLEQWQSLGTPPVLGIMKDLKQQREAVRLKQPILDYDPDCELANVARSIARRIS